MEGRRARRALVCAAAVAAMVLLSGCRVALTVDVAIDEQGAGTLALTVAADEEVIAQADATGADPFAELQRALADLEDEQWEVTESAAAGGGREVRIEAAFEDPAEFDELAAGVMTGLNAPEVALLEALSLRIEDRQLRLRGRAGLVPTDAVADYGLSPEEAAALAADVVDYRLRVSMPGELVTTTGAEASGPVLTWSPEPGEVAELEAVSVLPRQPLVPRVIGALVGALSALLLAVVWHRTRRHRMAPRDPR